MFKTNFLADDQARQLAKTHGTPQFVYSRRRLQEQMQAMLDIPAPYGLTVLYAMKANANPELLRIMRAGGIELDASSEYEVFAAIETGYKPQEILLTTQQLPKRLKELGEMGVQFNASSLRQLEEYGKLFPGSEASVRINGGIGSGHSNRVTTGGMASSFGIWYEYIPQVLSLAKKHSLTITRLHSHIGSGADPDVWRDVVQLNLKLIRQFEDATIINLGGGYKAARMDDERGADMTSVGNIFAEELAGFAKTTGRKLHLEVESGGFLMANSSILIASVDDIVDTGKYGYTFLKLDTGMNDVMRPAIYGAQHPIAVVSDTDELQEYVIVGHNCESSDLLSPAAGKPEHVQPRRMKQAKVGDIVLIGGVGAYCASFSTKGYNSYPNAQEIFIDD